MHRLLPALALVLIAAAPLADSGYASLSFEFISADQSEAVRLGDATESAAALAFHPRDDGTADLRLSVRARTEAGGVEYAAAAEVSARVPSRALTIGEVDAIARESQATLSTRGPVTQTQRRIRATDVRLRIDRVTDDEIHGSFWMHADRETEVRVNGQFVAPRPLDL